MKKRSTKLKWLGLTLASLGAVISSGAFASEAKQMKAESQGGIKIFNPADDSYWFSIGGRLNFDETLFSGGALDKQSVTDNTNPNKPRQVGFASGGRIRRAMLKFAGGVGEYLSYNLTVRFDGSSAFFEDAYVNACSEYTGSINRADIRFGQFTPPVTIDAWGNFGTDNDTVFLESALATTAFALPKKVYGVWADVSALDMFVLSASAYHPRQNNKDNFGNRGRSDRMGGNVRLTFVPVHTDDTVFHLGAVGRYQSVNNAGIGGVPVTQPALFSTRPEAQARNTASLVNTGNLRARSYSVVSGEALGLFGPAFVEAEYHSADVQRVPTINDPNSSGNPRFHGWHVQGGYMLTGESRVYDFMNGTLKNPKPANHWGAWEIAARYSYITLNNKNVYGGNEHNTTIGVNWFVNEHVKVGANYIRANIRPTSTPAATIPANTPAAQQQKLAKRQLDIFGIRFSVAF